VLSSSYSFFHDDTLFPRQNGYIHNLDTGVEQDLIESFINFVQAMLLNCFYGSFMVKIIATDHIKSADLIGGDVTVIHNPTAPN